MGDLRLRRPDEAGVAPPREVLLQARLRQRRDSRHSSGGRVRRGHGEAKNARGDRQMSDSDSKASQYLVRELADHADVVSRTVEAVRDVFPLLVAACLRSILQGHKLLFFGNGGSAADAQHFATELMVRYQSNRRAIAAL